MEDTKSAQSADASRSARRSIVVASTFAAEPLERPLRFWLNRLQIAAEIYIAAYGQVMQELLDPASQFATNLDGCNVILLRVEDWIRDLPETRSTHEYAEHLRRNAEDLVSAVRQMRKRSRASLLVCCCPSSSSRSAQDAQLIRDIEGDIVARLPQVPDVHAMTHADLVRVYPMDVYEDLFSDHLAHIPYTAHYYCALATATIRRLAGQMAPPCKVIVVDCDNTLWNGVCGECTPSELELTPGNIELQELLVGQNAEGVLICLCSKNEPEDVERVFRSRPDMPLKWDHLTSHRINWSAKSENLKSLARELNLGIESFVFIDDNPVECAEVEAGCGGGLLTVCWPKDPQQCSRTLRHIWAFDRGRTTEDARKRAARYKENLEREAALAVSDTFAEFLATLGLDVTVSPMAPADVERVAELVVRTNQFNLTTIRRSLAEIAALAENGELTVRVVNVSDRFGSYGLTGVVFFRVENTVLSVDTFLLSCRVLGRGVEERVINQLAREAAARGCDLVSLRFRRTAKNKPALDFLQKALGKFQCECDGGYRYDVPVDYAGSLSQEWRTVSTAPVVADEVAAAGPDGRTRWWRLALDLGDIANIVLEVDRGFRPAARASRSTREPPRTALETALARLWMEVLDVADVDRTDNFFELGGHSLAIVRLLQKLRASGYKVGFRLVFDHPVLQSQAAALDPEGGGIHESAPNLIGESCDRIEPRLLPLVKLSQRQIDDIVETVPGGAANVQDIYPLTPLQEGMLFHHLLSETRDTYLMSTVFALSTRERLDELIGALQKTIYRHDILRTAVSWKHSPAPVQVVYRRVTLPVFMLDSDAGSDPVKTLLGQAPETLDLQCAPLMRLYAMRAKEGEGWYALLQSHHLAGDNESLQAMLAEVMDHLNGRSDRLPVPGAYRDHVARTVSACEPEKAERFFRDKLSAVDEPTLPFGLADVHGQGDDIDEATREVDPSLGERVRAQARELCVSPATLFHAAWSLVVARTSGRDDVVFGTVLLGRMEGSAGTQPALGMFVNTLPLRLNLDGACARELVAQTQRELVDLLSHEQVSLATAQRCSGVAETTPLFSALLNYRHSDLSGGVSEGVKILARRERTNYPITLSIDDARDGFSFTAKTDKAVRASRIIEYLHTATASLVSALEQGSEVPALSLEILPEAEREQILRSFNATDKPLPREKSLHQLFEEQAGRTPDALALSYQDQWLSFSKLDAKANQVANRLRGLGAGPDRCVGLCLGRSLELVIGILGILKAGSAYVPLDPALPAARLQEIVEEIEAVALLTQSHLRDRLVHTGAGVFALDEWLREPMSDESGTFSSNVSGVSPHHLAYVIYTSGSTGKAKGVMIEHVNVVSLWSALEHLYIHKPGILRIGMNASFTFDSSIKQLVQLLSGRSVCIVPQACREDASLMLAFLERQHIEVIDCTPSQLKAWISAGLMERGLRLRMVLVGGEEIDEGLWGRLAACTSIDFVNVYGPTECTVDATAAFLRGDAGKPHIGRAMDHRRIYIVNHRADLVPIGVAGEICIGDASVGRGYLNREALTRERFRPDPFSEDAGARMYLSGDIGRWRADGVIEYLGRNDHQVKIRGYRIEVGEIEADLARHARVKDAVVVAREDCAGDKRLVAYFTLRDGAPPTAEELRVYLATRLPDYMIPRVFVNLDQLPLNANGKVNRRALPAPDPSADESKAFEAPQGEAEDVLAGIWRSVLAVERVGRHDDFFELGGHSLSAMQAIVRIRAAMSIDMPVSTLFRYPTVRLLAGRVAELSELRAGEAVLAGRPAPRSHECTMEGIS